MKSLTHGGWAERQGVLPGDVLMEVDGEDFLRMTSHDRLAILKRPRPLHFVIKRPAEAVQEKLDAAKGTDLVTRKVALQNDLRGVQEAVERLKETVKTTGVTPPPMAWRRRRRKCCRSARAWSSAIRPL